MRRYHSRLIILKTLNDTFYDTKFKIKRAISTTMNKTGIDKFNPGMSEMPQINFATKHAVAKAGFERFAKIDVTF